jgi:adenylyl-sulfate kinase
MMNGFTVWFTGMLGAGKSTLAQALANRLRRLSLNPEVLDGGMLHEMLQVGNAQTKEARDAESRRLAWLCKLVTRGGGIVLQAAVQSPNRDARDEARRQIGRFVEVFVDCQIDQLIARDRTGRYKKALAGEIKNLPGITEPYEPPTHPEVRVDTSRQAVDEAVEHLIGQLTALRYLEPHQAGLKSRPKLSAQPKIPLRPPPLSPPPRPILYAPPARPIAVQKAERKPDRKPERKPEHKPERKPEHKPEHKAERKAEHKPERKAERKSDRKGASASKPDAGKKALKPVLKAVPIKRTEPKASGKPAAKAQKVAAKNVRALPRPKLMVSKKPAAKAAVRPSAKIRVKPAPRVPPIEVRRAAGGRRR